MCWSACALKADLTASQGFVINVVTPQRTYHFLAGSEEEMLAWVPLFLSYSTCAVPVPVCFTLQLQYPRTCCNPRNVSSCYISACYRSASDVRQMGQLKAAVERVPTKEDPKSPRGKKEPEKGTLPFCVFISMRLYNLFLYLYLYRYLSTRIPVLVPVSVPLCMRLRLTRPAEKEKEKEKAEDKKEEKERKEKDKEERCVPHCCH